jgi:hypothetical protein
VTAQRLLQQHKAHLGVGAGRLSAVLPGNATLFGAYAKLVDRITDATGGAAMVVRADRRTGVVTCSATSRALAHMHLSCSYQAQAADEFCTLCEGRLRACSIRMPS